MAEFHFLRPWWLIISIIVVAATWLAWHFHQRQAGWARIIPEHLRQILLPDNQASSLRWPLLSISSALVIASIAMAGPTWQRLPQPVYNLQAGSVVIMDMSLSVYSTDVSPNRLEQMRFKATDLVREKLDGEIGLVAYAGDAFTISPLTGDGSNLTNLIRALSPELMPTPGSYPIRALTLADKLLREAGFVEGDIYWLTDGIDSRDQQDIADFIQRTKHRLNILAVGTAEGAPIVLPDGRMLRDSSNSVVIPTLTSGHLERLAAHSGGRFSTIESDQSDIDYLTSQAPLSRDGEATQMQAGDQWLDQGAWLIPIIMVLLLPLARRGVLFSMCCIVITASALVSPSSFAQTNAKHPLTWQQKLWQTPYQQADKALQAEDYERAAELAEDAWQRGTANYRAGNYEQALVDFSQVDSAEGYYNQGNALMQLQRYDEAQNAYAAALERRPSWPEAEQNKALAEQLSKQQESQQQPDQQGENQQGGAQQQGNNGDAQSDDTGDAAQQQSEQEADTQAEGTDDQEQEQAQQPQTDAEGQTESDEGTQEKPLASEFGDPASDEMQQQMQQWLNRIEDNPAELLRQKMRYEAQQRRRQGPPPGVEKQW